ncbi:MAG: chorismate mutase [Anaerosolibacter sp.]|jgi:shikimate kinase|nr:chorismate mutase [Anaerosolibacter sp.]
MLIISRRLQSKKLIPNNIVLTGFMGTGKSTIGKDLAKKLEMEYVDTDAFIENRVNMTIKDIFEKYGEDYFRSTEKLIIEEVSHLKNKIIICGGGVVLNKDNVMNLRKNGTIILLKAQPMTIYERLKQDYSRPILVLDGKICLEKVEALLKQREEAYRSAAHVFIQTDGRQVDEISQQIIALLYEVKN